VEEYSCNHLALSACELRLAISSRLIPNIPLPCPFAHLRSSSSSVVPKIPKLTFPSGVPKRYLSP
ncbi:hypothetical protein SERLA73DRAFT_145509, partial [Serpula lacrymans var. lacrymans S7.3]